MRGVPGRTPHAAVSRRAFAQELGEPRLVLDFHIQISGIDIPAKREPLTTRFSGRRLVRRPLQSVVGRRRLHRRD